MSYELKVAAVIIVFLLFVGLIVVGFVLSPLTLVQNILLLIFSPLIIALALAVLEFMLPVVGIIITLALTPVIFSIGLLVVAIQAIPKDEYKKVKS